MWEILPSLGFVPDADVYSDVRPGLSCNIGGVTVAASCVLGDQFNEVVLLTGVLVSTRRIAEICFEIPRKMESREQGLAWLVWGLDKAAGHGAFASDMVIPWIEEGRRSRNTLPWERDRLAYEARPCCSVEREWARLAFKKLAEQLSKVRGDIPVGLEFNGQVLSIRCAGGTIALPAEGAAWPSGYSIPAMSLGNLPKRLMTPLLEISIWKGALNLGRHRYDGVNEVIHIHKHTDAADS